MRDYGKVYSTFWSSPTTSGLSDDAKLLALYLMTCSHCTIAGVFRLPEGYVSEDVGWPAERVAQGFHELFTKGFSERCGTTKWVWIRKHLEWNKPENPNQRKSAVKIALSVPDECAWKPAFMRVCSESLGIGQLENGNPLETIAKPSPNQKHKHKQNSLVAASEFDGRFDTFWSAYPRKVAKDDARKAFDKRKPDGEMLDMILAAIEKQSKLEAWTKDGGKFIPHPATWLNGGRWQDGDVQGQTAVDTTVGRFV